MKNLIIGFVLIVAAVSPAQAQYQELIDLKITQLVQIQRQVVNVALPAETKNQALDQLATNLELLTQHRDEVSLEKLQQLETDINQINATLATQILASKKVRLTKKLNKLADMITVRKATGKDTAAFEALWREMNGVLQNL